MLYVMIIVQSIIYSLNTDFNGHQVQYIFNILLCKDHIK